MEGHCDLPRTASPGTATDAHPETVMAATINAAKRIDDRWVILSASSPRLPMIAHRMATSTRLRPFSDRIVVPARTDGGTRRYGTDDVRRLERVAVLLGEGLNLAGVGAAMRLQDRNTDLEARNEELEIRHEAQGKPAGHGSAG